MARDRSDPQDWLAMAELRGLCKEEAEEQWVLLDGSALNVLNLESL
jgi:hypothetical protein